MCVCVCVCVCVCARIDPVVAADPVPASELDVAAGDSPDEKGIEIDIILIVYLLIPYSYMEKLLCLC